MSLGCLLLIASAAPAPRPQGNTTDNMINKPPAANVALPAAHPFVDRLRRSKNITTTQKGGFGFSETIFSQFDFILPFEITGIKNYLQSKDWYQGFCNGPFRISIEFQMCSNTSILFIIYDRRSQSFVACVATWAIQATFCKNTYTASVSWYATLFVEQSSING